MGQCRYKAIGVYLREDVDDRGLNTLKAGGLVVKDGSTDRKLVMGWGAVLEEQGYQVGEGISGVKLVRWNGKDCYIPGKSFKKSEAYNIVDATYILNEGKLISVKGEAPGGQTRLEIVCPPKKFGSEGVVKLVVPNRKDFYFACTTEHLDYLRRWLRVGNFRLDRRDNRWKVVGVKPKE